MSEVKHTSPPWHIKTEDFGGLSLGVVEHGRSDLRSICRFSQLDAVHPKLATVGRANAAFAARAVNAHGDFCKLLSYVATCEAKNTHEWMQGLVDRINSVCAGLSVADRFEYCSEWIEKVQQKE